MKILLSPSTMYGHWSHCAPKVCEFQYGSTMIYVSYSDEKPMNQRLEIAQQTIDGAFDEIDEVLAFASEISARMHPEFWSNVERIPRKQAPLTVFAVRYPLESDVPIYEISWNPMFEPESGEDLNEHWMEEDIGIDKLPDDDATISVKRKGPHVFEQI